MWTIWLSWALAGPPSELVEVGSATWESELGPEQMQAVVDQAVDRVAEGFPRMFRGIVRNRLGRATAHCHTFDLAITEASWSSHCQGDERAFVRPWTDGPEPFLTRDGSTVHSRLEADGATARLTFDGANGHRTTQYRFEGDTLHLDVSVESERLPEPMTWSFRYARVRP